MKFAGNPFIAEPVFNTHIKNQKRIMNPAAMRNITIQFIESQKASLHKISNNFFLIHCIYSIKMEDYFQA